MSFKQPGHLKNHVNVHLNDEERQYECDLCLKVFKHEMTLKRHKKNVHEGNILDLTCDICGKMYTSPAGLKQHKDTGNYFDSTIQVFFSCYFIFSLMNALFYVT